MVYLLLGGDIMKATKNNSPISIDLTEDTKSLLENFCKKKEIDINDLVENAILEHIEDEMDRSIITTREHEEFVEWKKKKHA